MRVAPRLAIVFFAGLTTTLFASAAIRVHTEGRRFERDAVREQLALGRALARTAASLWEDRGEAAARALLDTAQLTPPDAIYWIDEDGGRSEEARRAIAVGDVVTSIEESPWPGRVTTVVPIPGRRAAIAFVDVMTERDEAVRGAAVRLLWYDGASALGFALIAMVGGWAFIARPMRAVVQQVQRVGAGDFGAPRVERSDEFGVISREVATTATQLASARDRLSAEIGARLIATEQLRHADRLATVGLMVAGLAHELATPLDVIDSRARGIARGEAGAADSATVISAQAQRLTSLARRLLDYGRKSTFLRQPCDLQPVLRAAADLLEPTARGRNVRISIEGGAARAVVDPGQMQQAVLNLALNGIQAMSGGGSLRMRTREDGAHVAIEIEDEGPGLAPEARERLFEPFFTTKEPGRGTGLGLSVTREIVREHGGAIEVESPPGRGACFRIVLPAIGGAA